MPQLELKSRPTVSWLENVKTATDMLVSGAALNQKLTNYFDTAFIGMNGVLTMAIIRLLMEEGAE